MSPFLKSWLLIGTVLGSLGVAIIVLHNHHGSLIGTLFLVVLSVVVSTSIGEHAFRAFNGRNTSKSTQDSSNDNGIR